MPVPATSLLSRIFASTFFPLALCTAIGTAVWMMSRGMTPVLAILPGIVGSYLVIALCERVFPYQQGWLHSQRDLGTDSALFVTNGVLNRLIEPPVLAGSVVLGAGLAAEIGIGLWPSAWPILAQLCLALVVAEFVEYWFHRLMHEKELLWRLHATHHSAPRLYWLNAARFHPIDLFLVGTGKLVPLAVLGASEQVFALVVLFSAVHGAFQHANLQIRLGPLNWVFSMAELHRWHHSRNMREANTNYGGNLIVWDIVFGTRFLPTDRQPPADIGLADLPAFPMTFLAQLASPFRWKQITGASTAREVAPAGQ
jgi:sterol desaturase/sphingolipid hydroxylase (fatty acid hydroxylase superfamily)